MPHFGASLTARSFPAQNQTYPEKEKEKEKEKGPVGCRIREDVASHVVHGIITNDLIPARGRVALPCEEVVVPGSQRVPRTPAQRALSSGVATPAGPLAMPQGVSA